MDGEGGEGSVWYCQETVTPRRPRPHTSMPSEHLLQHEAAVATDDEQWCILLMGAELTTEEADGLDVLLGTRVLEDVFRQDDGDDVACVIIRAVVPEKP